ncbi:MAG: elongation factor Ts [Bacteroidetes bacterium]|nr:elongation factor Ts [Bacteroidota bacterium]
MTVTADMVKHLRERTGAGMMECKKALDETNGDFEKAIEILRKKGAATAAKRADKEANEGLVVSKISDDAKKGILLEVNCETDFVSRGEDFKIFVDGLSEVIFKHTPKTNEELLKLPFDAQRDVAAALADIMAKIGEKTEIKRFSIITSESGFVESYIHMGSKIGVMVELSTEFSPEKKTLARDIAMQIAAMNPITISRDQITKEIVAKELEIYKTQAKNEGKPEAIADKIATGRLEKFYQETVLLEQSFIKDAGKTIKDVLGGISVKQFQRFQIGEITQ